MAVTCGFFNAVNYDRLYNATQISKIFDGLITDGVYLNGGALVVSQNTVPNLQVKIGPGRAWFKHTWTYNDATFLLSLQTPDIVWPRIDAVVLEVNSNNAVRENTIKIIKGTAQQVPVEPVMIHAGNIDQYRLANIAVAANATQILDANITIKVGTVETPFVSGVLSSFDVETLVAQWDSFFDNTWLPARLTDFSNWLIAREAEFDNNWLPARETDFAAWLVAREVEFDAWIVAREVEFDAWIATLNTPVMLPKRQGGDPDYWWVYGTTNYDIADAPLMQMGAIRVTIPDQAMIGNVTVTFPTAFSKPPLIIASSQVSADFVVISYNDASVSGVQIWVKRLGSVGILYVDVGWIAIGPN